MLEYIVIGLFFGYLGGWACELCIRGVARLRKPIIIQWEWKDINKFPIPEVRPELNSREILVTDGEQVDNIYLSCVHYNSKRQPVFGYEKRIITHWAEFPSPPIT
ncbi:hypothetical protein UFOVP264_53 [uncultured Caudovirales phage]|uniref:DUF551 domain-containing protein n=1 Tax=uncultured Caudovirales phage TaxID=2100421 RepID=A0A6J5LJZ9_9CAUD|nr:hypothetical protein UFOVP264_53 [uncultured Caudovirales phage]